MRRNGWEALREVLARFVWPAALRPAAAVTLVPLRAVEDDRRRRAGVGSSVAGVLGEWDLV